MDNITDKEVAQWLHDVNANFPVPGGAVQLFSSCLDGETRFLATIFGVSQPNSAPTLAEAVANLRAIVKTPAQLAAEKREQAAKLLAEAEELEK